MNRIRAALANLLRAYPWSFAAIALAALVIQLIPAAREPFIYDRAAVAAGQLWRLWTGHLVHFGWPHFIADMGLLLALGYALGRRHPRFVWSSFVVLPPVITLGVFVLEPEMNRYAGLSAVDLSLLLYLALAGWQRDWRDWFWPAVLAVYVFELGYEILRGGTGGGMIRFDEADVRVATTAHLVGAAYALLAWLIARRQRTPAGD